MDVIQDEGSGGEDRDGIEAGRVFELDERDMAMPCRFGVDLAVSERACDAWMGIYCINCCCKLEHK